MPDVSLSAIPEDLPQFLALLDQLRERPEGAAAGVILALALLATDRELGRRCLEAAAPALPASRFRFVEERLAGQEYLPSSYLLGTHPENGYRPGEMPILMRFSTNPYSGDPAQGTVKLFVECSGADSPRPVTLKRDPDGRWAPVEWSSLLSGIRPPNQP